jgi:hypothetical protein
MADTSDIMTFAQQRNLFDHIDIICALVEEISHRTKAKQVFEDAVKDKNSTANLYSGNVKKYKVLTRKDSAKYFKDQIQALNVVISDSKQFLCDFIIEICEGRYASDDSSKDTTVNPMTSVQKENLFGNIDEVIMCGEIINKMKQEKKEIEDNIEYFVKSVEGIPKDTKITIDYNGDNLEDTHTTVLERLCNANETRSTLTEEITKTTDYVCKGIIAMCEKLDYDVPKDSDEKQ